MSDRPKQENPQRLAREAMTKAAGAASNHAEVIGAMPRTAEGKPRFPSRSDGYEAAIVAGTAYPVYTPKG